MNYGVQRTWSGPHSIHRWLVILWQDKLTWQMRNLVSGEQGSGEQPHQLKGQNSFPVFFCLPLLMHSHWEEAMPQKGLEHFWLNKCWGPLCLFLKFGNSLGGFMAGASHCYLCKTSWLWHWEAIGGPCSVLCKAGSDSMRTGTFLRTSTLCAHTVSISNLNDLFFFIIFFFPNHFQVFNVKRCYLNI